MARACFFAALVLSAVAMRGAPPTQRTMAITFDDLPYVSVGAAPFLPAAERTTSRILRVLRAHHAPATGFVNESKLQAAGEVPARTTLLRHWVTAGLMLGNHTYSHPDFNRLTVAQFEREIARGDVVTRQLMQGRRPYQLYFRHPMTYTGNTVEKKEAIEAYLAARGYKVTPHTIENSDFIFNVGYANARARGDSAQASRLRDAYLAFTIDATNFAEQVSPRIFGRDIPQTLLIHANDINADCLDAMLTRFAQRGYTFVSLDSVMRDAAYQTKDTWVGPRGPTWLWRWMKSKGMNVSFKDDPDVPGWVMNLYDAR